MRYFTDLSEQQEAKGAETWDIMFPEQKSSLTAAIRAWQGRSSTRLANLSTAEFLCSPQSRENKRERQLNKRLQKKDSLPSELTVF